MTHTDTERLEWLVEESLSINGADSYYLLDSFGIMTGENVRSDGRCFKDWRELIDYNMELDNES